MTEGARPAIPPGEVSAIRGYWQAPVLYRLTRVLIGIGVMSMIVPDAGGRLLADTAVALVIAVPLLRIAWLVRRWAQERDWRFAAVGTGLLGVVGLGALLAALGVG